MPVIVHNAKVAIHVFIALFHCLQAPPGRLCVILPDAMPAVVHLGQVAFRAGIALLSSLPAPCGRLGVILADSEPQIVHLCKVGLSVGIALLRGLPEPAGGISAALLLPEPEVVRLPKSKALSCIISRILAPKLLGDSRISGAPFRLSSANQAYSEQIPGTGCEPGG